ncbi:MAG: flagellar basal-body rod protein FlgG [Methylicorpusculum sp.]|uniref:flagellar basal-body rod protein FlgG n=1 Tax=Methylicorpusculum TaxID=2713642 RepID=UPI00135C1025|nr:MULTISPECIES: flagellar basal-body rod protein FlgG [Methylicorpusculum]MCD2450566.1 flagellar basal-body rod protein FlgG [Methylicorpusculum oleiharenae]MDO8843819.1 flagellar basal-body rod protein FlgG [Methylicorpusculum sp.]MDO8940230.1 flagellar basal-body rod protein FlgG [Methylicorpusculum sp.]MDP2178193.1 flagellar basal-body rod protein FlgG [Methylicorpusculum sp.]MDP2201099.1 flagellar basal-body rod protein FlgG [Methylicorpusculum sp.]
MTERALWVAKSGLDAQQTRMAIIANNLANVNTTGFKKSRPLFEDLIYQNIRQVGAQSTQGTRLPTGLQLGTGVRTVATEKLHTQGNIQQTENSLDVAISGKGFFQILSPNGDINYTRDGSFKLDDTGQVVTSEGMLLEPAITVPNDSMSLTIGRDGTVTVVQPGNPAAVQIGQIQTADFINTAGLEPIGENLFRESTASGPPVLGIPGENELGALYQGSLETSNVNVVEELVNMIETQRAYEMNSKAISTTDQMLSFVTQQL